MSEISVPILDNEGILIEEACAKLECPFCKKIETPSLIVGLFKEKDIHIGQIVDAKFVAKFPCCNSLYTVSCKWLTKYADHDAFTPEGGWTITELPKIKGQLPDTVKRLAPSFEDIYAEAQKAKNDGLMLICGGAYRKALEFLLKEYAMALHPDNKDEIRKMGLSSCIAEYIDNDIIKCFADRAAWIGNDELHYMRKWEDRDVFDLEDFIEHSILAIDLEERRKELEKNMPKEKKKNNKKKKEAITD